MEYNERKEQDRIDSMMNHKILGFPIIKKILDLKELHSVEEDLGRDKLKSLLDMFEGSDSIGILNNNLGVIGISSRVQWAHPVYVDNPYHPPSNDYWLPEDVEEFHKNKGYKTFTIRFKRVSRNPTEYRKRVYAILKGTSYPIYTIHQYVSDRYAYKGLGELLSLAICRTKDLILLIKNGKQGIHYDMGRSKNYGEADFFKIEWSLFIKYYPIWFYPYNFIKLEPQQQKLFKFIKAESKIEKEI